LEVCGQREPGAQAHVCFRFDAEHLIQTKPLMREILFERKHDRARILTGRFGGGEIKHSFFVRLRRLADFRTPASSRNCYFIDIYPEQSVSSFHHVREKRIPSESQKPLPQKEKRMLIKKIILRAAR